MMRPWTYPIDTCEVNVTVTDEHSLPLTVYGISANCYQCQLQRISPVIDAVGQGFALFNGSVVGNFPMILEFRRHDQNNKDTVLHRTTLRFGDRGVYALTYKGGSSLDQRTLLAPLQPWLPWIVAGSVYAGLFLVYVAVTGWLRWQRPARLPNPRDRLLVNTDPVAEKTERTAKNRVAALDAFRGLCLVVMIFVNYGGGGYWYTTHSRWNGLTVADLVFPWFVFIMGVGAAITLDKRRRTRTEQPLKTRLWSLLRRSVILFWLGLFLNNGYDLANWRIPGVLQRFGVAFFVVGLMIFFVPKLRRFERQDASDRLIDLKADFLPFIFEWLLALTMLAVWFGVTFLMPVPGCPTGYIGPGGISMEDDGPHPNCTGGAAFYIDKLVFGLNRLYQTPTSQSLYLTGPYDPEGLLGNLTSIFICFLGLHTGRIIVTTTSTRARVFRWSINGFVLALVGASLCGFKQNGGFDPLCKNRWSSSFVLVMAGLGNWVLAVFYLLIDHYKVWVGSPLRFVGMNSILLYMSHEILNPYFPFAFKWANSHGMELFSNLLGLSCWVTIAYLLYKNAVFVKI